MTSYGMEPRAWQKMAADQCVAHARAGADRELIYACPGSGKTFGSLLVAGELIQRVRKTKHLLVLTSNLAIKSQWIATAKGMGLELLEVDDAHMLQQRALPMGVSGYIISYQKAARSMTRSLRVFCEEHAPVVILDEVHHTAGGTPDNEGNAWGVAVELALGRASFKLCTTGTPFREGNNPIAFVHYNEAGEATAGIRYTYEQAISDGVCRPLQFEFYGGSVDFTSRSTGRSVSVDFDDKLSKKLSSERLEAALSLDGKFPLQMLTDAHARLEKIREGDGVDAEAAGLVLAIDVKHAKAIAEALYEITGERPVVVHEKVDDAQEKIAAFRSGKEQWIVGINMLSEGVDIKRLRVGVYASRIRTPLYFHQFCGRFTRVQKSCVERSYIYLPRDPELEAIAIEIEKEIFHALGEEPRRIGRGGGYVRGRRRELNVEESDAAPVASALNGLLFPREYIERHRALLTELRLKGPAWQSHSDVEMLKMLIDIGRIDAPADAA